LDGVLHALPRTPHPHPAHGTLHRAPYTTHRTRYPQIRVQIYSCSTLKFTPTFVVYPFTQAVAVPRIPLVLVPLTDSEKQNDSALMTSQGVVFGNRSDFKMNTSIVHESGTLLLGVDDVRFLDHSFLPLQSSSLGAAAGAGSHMAPAPLYSQQESDGEDDDMGGPMDDDSFLDLGDTVDDHVHGGDGDSYDDMEVQINVGAWARLGLFFFACRG
jgi:hypothetical protein